MDEQKSESPDIDSRTRAQAKKELHARKQKERQQEAADLKAAYANDAENVVVQDIIEKAKAFQAWHNKLAIDGVGARNKGFDDSGAPIVEDYYLTDSQIARELGGASALQQLITYIENKLN